MKDFDVLKKNQQLSVNSPHNKEKDIDFAESNSSLDKEENVQRSDFKPIIQLKASSDLHPNEKSKYDQPLGKKGLPDRLKSNMESLSRINLDNVSVQYNSNEPGQLKAEAFAQNNNIHVAPGKEHHLAHEAWHIVQQKQGRVKSTGKMLGIQVNDENSLENEADLMGHRALTGDYNMSPHNQIQSNSSDSPVQMWNPFKKKKKQNPVLPNVNLAGNLEKLNTGTASDVYKAKTDAAVGNSGMKSGFAKKALKSGDEGNSTTTNLGFSQNESMTTFSTLTEDPNLIARQVISSRLDKALGLNVLADEVFSKDTDGTTLGITGMAQGTQAMENLDNGKQKHNWFDWSNPQTQKDLANLQLLDYITGQQDRHLGNMFIDQKTGKVTGIDNDMAFASDMLHATSQNSLSDQTEYNREANESKFLQDQIDAKAGNALLEMSEQEFWDILSGEEGDLEKIDEDSKGWALQRFRLAQKRVLELKGEGRGNGKLINKWNDKTYAHSTGLGTGYTQPGTGENAKKFEKNYVARGVIGWDNSGKDDRQNTKVQGQKPFAAVKPSKKLSNRRSRGKWKRKRKRRKPQSSEELKKTLKYAGLW